MNQSIRKHAFNLPNILTYGRILVIPVILVLMGLQSSENTLLKNQILSYTAAGLFILAGISDLIDGYFARKLGQVSILGKLVDPLADKLVHMGVMIMMIPMSILPAWLVIVLLFRELIVTGLRGIAATQGVVIDAGILGKKKTVLLNIGLSALLMPYGFFGISTYTVGWFAIGFATVVSVISGYLYVHRFFKTLT